MNEAGFMYRTFYTWDHSTNWDLTQPGAQVSGSGNEYSKPQEAFMEDYTRLIDYMSELKLNHLIIWGALRDSHGGVDALKRLIEYGRAKGVRVAPGVGIGCYGGSYYDGDHKFSLIYMLQKHPELSALGQDGKPMRWHNNNPRRAIACPRNERVMDWTLRSIRWLMAEVNPDAIHFETGDYGVCQCELCQEAGSREMRTSNEDMAEVLPPVVAEVRAYRTDCLLSYNHYTGYKREMMINPPAFARQIPGDVICKWGVSRMFAPKLASSSIKDWQKKEPMDPMFKPPTINNMGHLHFGSGHWGSPRGTLEIARFLVSMPLISKVGFQGVCMHGEESNLNPPAELNYHVYAALAENPDALPSDIARWSVGEIYGDQGLAADVLNAFKGEDVPRDLPPRVAKAAAKADGQTKVRLNWLTFELHGLAERTSAR
ncbi:hypothetical protein ACFL6S_05160 [Candidatus Poribacteria bacterium]